MEIVITLRSVDCEGNKINNTKDKNAIVNFASDFFNCEEIEIRK